MIEMIRPTTSPTRSSGPAMMSVSRIPPCNKLIAVPRLMLPPSAHFQPFPLLPETSHQLHGDQPPTVDKNKKNQLERHGNHDGRQHDHSHGQERRGDDHVDDDKRDKQQDPDL